MRASRLLSVLLLLQARGQLTAGELARELEVSERTIYRDIDALNAAGVPVYAERGPAGGYQLLDGYRTRLTGLTQDEAETLLLTGLAKPAAELGLGEALANAQLKLLAALPPELGSSARRAQERLHLDTQMWFRQSDATPYLQPLAEAVWEQRRVWMHYQRTQKQVERIVNPLGLVLKAGIWYLAAAVEDGLRTYRVSRVQEMEILDESFERPDDFDLAHYWQEWSERFESWIYRDEALVRLSPWAVGFVQHLFNPTMVEAVERQRDTTPDAEGWITVQLPIESIQQAPMDLLRLGEHVEVLEPAELRQRMREIAHELVKLYGDC